jgi:hypothetical protein
MHCDGDLSCFNAGSRYDLANQDVGAGYASKPAEIANAGIENALARIVIEI